MTSEETKHYAVQAVLRAAIREDFVSKFGKLKHSIGTYDRLIRVKFVLISKIRKYHNVVFNARPDINVLQSLS
jgi:hypothetical protein